MPILEQEINELHKCVTRPVALAVTQHVKKLTGIPQDTTTIFLGNSGAAVLEGATVEGSQEPTRFATTNKVFIEVNEELIPEDNLMRYTTQHDQVRIFHDPALGLEFYPIYSKARLTVSLKYRAQDKLTAERWRNGIASKFSQGRIHHLHELTYHYIVPKALLVVLVECYNLREAQHGYGDTLQEYTRKHFSEKAFTLTTAAGTQPQLAIKERALQSVGHFDFDNPPMEEKEDIGAVWTTQVDYILEYDRPTAVVGRYPISVHSQLINEALMPKQPEPYTGVYPQAQRSYSLNALQKLVGRYNPNLHNAAVQGMVYPVGDDWYPSRAYKSCSWLGRWLVVPDDDLVTMANLKDLPDVEIDPAVLAYLARWPQYATVHRESPIFVKLHEQNEEHNISEYFLTKDLDLVTHDPQNPRKVYHLTIGILNDLSLLTPGAKDRVRHDPDFVKVITGKDPGPGVVDPGWWDRNVDRATDDLMRRTVTYYQLITHRPLNK